ncbi:ATP-binding protein [Photobacterium satsumensis]|uniref:sensor histidine kinase n=1 Tax=Photobacterium satsumensis TaxID=2910239 RepID=UPI003D13B992
MENLSVFIIYLIYGLAFFAIGFSITFRNLKFSRLQIATALPTLAVFGFIHGLHEWSELYLILHEKTLSKVIPIEIFKVTKLWVSFLALGAFAWKMLEVVQWKHRQYVKSIIVGTIFIYSLFLINNYYSLPSNDFLFNSANQIRWIFGFGASLLSGYCLFIYGQQLNNNQPDSGIWFQRTGFSVVAYGIAAGLLLTSYGIWVPVVRTLCAVAISITLWRALMVFDLERLRQIKATLQQSLQHDKFKELGELTSAIAHEIKTPLSSAIVSCDLLERQLPSDNDNAHRQLNRIRNGMEKAANISHEVLNYAHQRTPNYTNIDLAELVKDTLDMMSHRLAHFSITMSVPEKLSLEGDHTQVQELFINLLNNAIDACGVKGAITISANPMGEHILIRVTDNGPGMSDDILAAATKPFYTTKPAGKGTGLGLSICKQITSQHQGQLSFKNTDNGLCVEIELPKEQF